jgi:hypothetical protein
MRVRIRRLPPAHLLEGFDLRTHQLEVGQVYELGQRLSEVLVVSGYAEYEMRDRDRNRGEDEPG